MAQQLFNSIALAAVLLLFSLGLSLAWGTLDVLNLAHGALFVAGAYTGYELGKIDGLPFVAVMALVMVGCGLLAAALELVAFGRVRKKVQNKRQAELSILVASLGGSIVINQYVANRTDHLAFSPSGNLFTLTVYNVAGLRVTNIQLLIIGVTAVIAVAIAAWSRWSRQGRAARAVAFSPRTAQMMGINTSLVGIRVMFISGALAGLAGFLLMFQIAGVDVSTGGTYMLSAFAILVLGGVGSVLGASVAALIVATTQTMVGAYGPSGLQAGVAFLLIFVMLLVRPEGLIARRQTERA